MVVAPRLDILPPAQRRLWPELAATPDQFTLYGGTAIALRLGHRASVDFDFFSTVPFVPMGLMSELPYLSGSTARRIAANTLTVTVERGGPVQLSFFGGLRIGQVTAAERVDGIGISIASLLDLGGTKVAVITQRAEVKDYLDIHALVRDGGLTLADMLAGAQAIYGDQFKPLLALKAIGYHDDPALAGLASSVRRDLAAAVRSVDLSKLPTVRPIRAYGGTS